MMGIYSAPAPGGLRVKALAEIKAVASTRRSPGSDLSSDEGGGGEQSPRTAADPLPIYSIPLASLAHADDPFLAAAQHGWRVLAEGGGGKRLVDLKGTDATAVPSVVRGARSAAMLEKAGHVAVQTAPEDVAYQARVLDLSKVGMSLLWLHSADGANQDRFYSLAEQPAELSPTAVIDAARKSALRRMSASTIDGERDRGDELPTGERSSVERGG